MTKIFTIAPTGYHSPGLFDSFTEVFKNNGYSFTGDINEATGVFYDLHSGLFDYDFDIVNKVIEKKLPVVAFDQFDYFSGGGYSDTFFERCVASADKHWAIILKMFTGNDLLKVYFMRKMSKTVKYPSNFYPLELYQFPGCDFPPTTKEELFSRPVDITFIGNTATPRKNICEGLEKHFKCDFVLGQPRLEHEDWLNRHRQSKLFIECGGGGESSGGFNSERSYQLITISPMLKTRDEQLILNDWEEDVDCLRAGDELGIISEADIAKLGTVLSEPDTLYSIYLKGIEKMHKYFNPTYRANYVLVTLKQNNVV